MRINNVSSKMSKQLMTILFVFSLIAVLGYSLTYYFSNYEHSVSGFFLWIMQFVKSILENNPEDKVFLFILLVVAPICIIFGFLAAAISYIKARKEFYSTLNLKSIDMFFDRIQFNFTQPQYNFACAYSDIEDLTMNIKTTTVHTKSGTHTAFQELILNFKLLNNKVFTLNNTTTAPMKLIYGILNYTRDVQKFSYYFSGSGTIEDMREKIENYRQTGRKRLLSSSGEDGLKLISMIFFCISVFFLWSFRDAVEDFAKDSEIFFVFIPFFIFGFASLIMDIFLVINQIDKKGYVFVPKKYEYKIEELLHKTNIWHILIIKAIIFAFLSVTCLQPILFSDMNKQAFNPQPTSISKNLKINPPSEYNYLTKKQVFDIREKFVKQSIFYKKNYKPSEEVFGQIVDNKPWWGLISCSELDYKGDYHERIEGDSKVSIQMNNPNALVGLSLPYMPWKVKENMEFCTSDYAKYIPFSLKYNEKEKLITAKYELTKNYINFRTNINGQRKRFPIQLSGLNARDFGYNYVWAFDAKNIKPLYEETTSVLNNLVEFRDFVHRGGSCKFEGGCNNISPMQNDLMITITDLPAEIDLKLWKKQPGNKFQKADFYYKIIFEAR